MNASRNRKIAYLLCIVVLFCVMIVLNGFIAKEAEERKLTQTSLGKINPVSSTAQLVFMGFRGVAVSFLWHDAIEMKRQERWFEIRPVLESITLLQPNFVEPWTFQGWNMAWNIASEWEAVSDKLYWIREGIQFMKNACAANRDMPDLEWYTGFMYHNRIGVSDEKFFLRELFRQFAQSKDPADIEFAQAKCSNQFDNFDCAFDWFTRGNETILRTKKRPKKQGIHPFMSYPPQTIAKQAEFMAKEGKFGEPNKNAWRRSHNLWLDFGRRGEPNPSREDVFYRLEYTPEEFSQLTPEQRYWANHYARIVNYYFWKRHTLNEATDTMQLVNESAYTAEKARKSGDYATALERYETVFPNMMLAMSRDMVMIEHEDTKADVYEWEDDYLNILRRLEMDWPQALSGEALTKEEKAELKLAEDAFAFKQDEQVTLAVRTVGVKANDVIIGIDDFRPKTLTDFHDHLLNKFKPRQKAVLHVIRAGKPKQLDIVIPETTPVSWIFVLPDSVDKQALIEQSVQVYQASQAEN